MNMKFFIKNVKVMQAHYEVNVNRQVDSSAEHSLKNVGLAQP